MNDMHTDFSDRFMVWQYSSETHCSLISNCILVYEKYKYIVVHKSIIVNFSFSRKARAKVIAPTSVILFTDKFKHYDFLVMPEFTVRYGFLVIP